MLTHQFPDLEWLKRQANSSFADRKSMTGQSLPVDGWPNVIMNARAQEVVRDNIRGPLSLFSNVTGRSTVTAGKKRVTVSPDVLFITNPGQYYTLEIHEPRPAETANIHFGDEFSREALRAITLSPAQLLEESSTASIPNFFNRIVPAGPEYKYILNGLLTPGRTTLQEEQDLYQLLVLVSEDEQQLQKTRDRVTAIKSSTKEEIMKRMLQVTDYLYSQPEVNPDLEELARISCLSKFHFLRLFKIAFGQTPHQYITSIKVNRARTMLSTSNADVKAIATTLGYADASTFSRAFYRQLGLYPSQYRAQS